MYSAILMWHENKEVELRQPLFNYTYLIFITSFGSQKFAFLSNMKLFRQLQQKMLIQSDQC